MPRARISSREPRAPRRYYELRKPNPPMKLSLRSITSLAVVVGGIALTQSGCSSTATRESTGEYIDDAAISTKVKAALIKDPIVKAADVKVETFKGTVQLSGFVDNAEQKAQAERIAAGINGVMAVKNNIALKTAVR
jgi:hyperosmotically inducible periplasmic protein